MMARRWGAAIASVAVPLVLVGLGGHAGQHMVRNLLVPGAGLYEQHLALGVALTLAAVGATIGWVRWGTDWVLVLVIVVSVVASGLTANAGHAPEVQAAAHEFPLVVLVVMALGWARSAVRRVPGADRIRIRREVHVVDRCRAAAIAALAADDGDGDEQPLDRDAVEARARRVGLVARGRIGGDPLRVDHAHARAALALTGRLDDDALARFRADAAASWAGVPCSEPGWVRLLDGTLAAIATDAGDRWAEVLAGHLRLRRGHRPAWVWNPLGVAAGRADEWEHAAATALARSQGWVDDGDWPALRQRTLGAAARGARTRPDERLVAAGRLWVAQVDDPQAERILQRPTIGHDPIARALDALARQAAARRTEPC